MSIFSTSSNSSGAHCDARILLVEDDELTRDTLAEGLRLYGYRVSVAGSCEAARGLFRRQRFDAILLDVNLPDDSGFELLCEIRVAPAGRGALSPGVPVLMLSGRGGEADRVRGFELGCDDYVVKPYSFSELRGRLAAQLRRALPAGGSELQQIGELEIDYRGRAVFLAGGPVGLTTKEWSLLTALASDPLRVFTRDQLLQSVWGYRTAGSTRTLDAHACRLRAKLSAGTCRYVINLWGVGYRLVDQPPESPRYREDSR